MLYNKSKTQLLWLTEILINLKKGTLNLQLDLGLAQFCPKFFMDLNGLSHLKKWILTQGENLILLWNKLDIMMRYLNVIFILLWNWSLLQVSDEICNLFSYNTDFPSGDRFEEALAQTVDDLSETMEHLIECYVIVQRGVKIAFFEYHNDQSNLDEEDIPHFRGCVSLTQNYNINQRPAVVFQNMPNNLELLFHNTQSLRTGTTNPTTQDLRLDASNYRVPCVFDITTHHEELNFIFHHILNNPPRSSIWIFRILFFFYVGVICI